MLKIAIPVVALVAWVCLPAAATRAATLTQCPAMTVKGAVYTGCNFLISENPGDIFFTSSDGNQPFFSGEDSYVGFQNNTDHPVSAIIINGGTDDLFGFDNDGPSSSGTSASFCPTTGSGLTGYEGPNNTFSHVSADCTLGEVDFTAPIAPGGRTYFFMEGLIDPSVPPVGASPLVPEPPSIVVLVTALSSLALARLLRRAKRWH